MVTSWRALVRALCAGMFLLTCLGTRAEAPLVEQLAPIVARVLSYERTLPSRAGGRVDAVILYGAGDAASEREANELHAGFRQLSGTTVQGLALAVQLLPYHEKALQQAFSAADVVLVCSGLDQALPRIAEKARERGVLTIGLRREYAKAATSLAVILEEGRPRIIANLRNASAERVQLSAQLLRRAEIL